MSSKQTQTLVGMPNEMLHAICQYLYPEDIKILRLVDKRMCDLSSEYLMKVYYALRPKTHAVFSEICDHPIFSRSVVEIVYDASMFTEQHAQAWHPESDEDHKNCMRQGRATQEVAAMEYAKLLDFQDNLISSGDSEQVLLEGFGKLRNLRSVSYTDCYNIILESRRSNAIAHTVGHSFPWQLQKRLTVDRIGTFVKDLWVGTFTLPVFRKAFTVSLV